MMKLKNIILEAKHDATKSDMNKWFLECMRKYFPEYSKEVGVDWPFPIFEIKTDKTRAGWYKCKFRGNQVVDPIIGLNTIFVSHTGRNVTFHETIHYVQSNIFTYRQYNQMANKGHDSFFIQSMNKINSVEGKDYITVQQDTAALDAISGNKEFWVYGIKTHRGEFAFAYSATERPNVETHLKKQLKINSYKSIYVFKSDKFKYRLGSVTKTSIKFGVPNDQDNIEQEISKYEIKD